MCSIIRHLTMQVPQNQYSRFSRRYLVQQAMGSECYKYRKAAQCKKRQHVSRSGTPDPPDLSRGWSNRPEDKSYSSALMYAQRYSTFYHMSYRDRQSASIDYYAAWSKIKCPKLKKEMRVVFERAFRRTLPRNEENRRQIRSESPMAQRRHHPATQRGDRTLVKSRRSRDRAEVQEQEQVKERKGNMTVPGPLAQHGQAHNEEDEAIIAKMQTLIVKIGTSMKDGWAAACDESIENCTNFAECIRSLPKISKELSFLIDH